MFPGCTLLVMCLMFFLERMRKGHCQSSEHWNCFNGIAGQTSARWGGTHKGFPECLETSSVELDGTELGVSTVLLCNTVAVFHPLSSLEFHWAMLWSMHWSVTVGTHALVVSILASLWPEVLSLFRREGQLYLGVSNGPNYAGKESPRDTWRQLVLALSVKTLWQLFLKLSTQHQAALIIQSVNVIHLGHCSVDWA